MQAVGNVLIFEVIFLEKSDKKWQGIFRVLTYVLVAVAVACLTFVLTARYYGGTTKLQQLENVILNQFIGDADKVAMEDAAAEGMIASLGDRWSYYIPASEFQAHKEQLQNAYVGVGITVQINEETKYLDIQKVEPTGGAKEAGILPGDVLTEVDGKDVSKLGLNDAAALIRGEEGTDVSLKILRDGKEMEFFVTRKTIKVQVAKGQMLEDNIGYIKIVNFDARCAQETIDTIKQLLKQGAKSLIFDVRFNPGGYQSELVDVLDYLLPEGEIFRSQYYTGHETVDTSDAACLEIPMAVLINADSYSAAEFFAAALNEYDWAIIVGQATTGKGYFQTTISLRDGSAANLSIGKYFTPKGVSLGDAGGLKPEVPVEVDEETAADIYAGLLPVEEDPQVQAAAEALKKAS